MNFNVKFFFRKVFLLCSVAICISPVVSNGNILDKCGEGFQEMIDCAQYKSLKMLDRLMVIKKPISLARYVYLTHEIPSSAEKEDPAAGNFSTMAEEKNYLEEEKNLLESGDSAKLTETLMKRISKVAKAKSLQINLEPADEIIQQGRKKDKKGAGMIMMMMMGGGAMLMNAAFGTIALLAGKALIIAKIALVLSSIIGLKKLVGQDEQSQPQAQVIYAKSEGHGGGGWQHRSIDAAPIATENAQNLAYNAHYRRKDQ